MAKTTITMVTVLVDRDATTKLPVVVPEYELPILLEIYGEEQVAEVESKDVEKDDFDLQATFDGLVGKYRRNAAGDAARRMYYPKASSLEKKLGLDVSAKGAKAKGAKARADAADAGADGGESASNE